MNDLIVRQREQKILGEGIDHAERQFVLMVLAVQGIPAHVPQRVVHPAHVPLHAEAESPGVDGPRHAAPRGRLFRQRQDSGVLLIQQCVHVLEELDRLQVLAPAEHVRHPLAMLARVVEIQHRRHRIDPQSVDVIDIEPEAGARQQEIADLFTSVVEDQRAPVGVEALARVGVFVETRSIEGTERMAVGREVRRNPIDDDADPRLMELVHELHEVVRRSKPAGRCEVARCLITPRSVEWELVDRHQFDVRVAQILHVVDQ